MRLHVTIHTYLNYGVVSAPSTADIWSKAHGYHSNTDKSFHGFRAYAARGKFVCSVISWYYLSLILGCSLIIHDTGFSDDKKTTWYNLTEWISVYVSFPCHIFLDILKPFISHNAWHWSMVFTPPPLRFSPVWRGRATIFMSPNYLKNLWHKLCQFIFHRH